MDFDAVIFAAVVGSVAALSYLTQKVLNRFKLDSVIVSMGLKSIGDPESENARYDGRIDGFNISLTVTYKGARPDRIEVTVDGRGLIPLDVELREGSDTNRRVTMVRQTMRRPRIAFEEGRIICSDAAPGRYRLRSFVRLLIDLAKSLRVPEEEARALLVSDLHHHKSADRRKRAFDLLLSDFSITPALTEALLEDEDPDVLLRAGKKLGQEGIPHLMRAVKLQIRDLNAGGEALLYLASNYASPEVLELIEEQIASNPVALTAIQAAGIVGQSSFLPRLFVLLEAKDRSVRETAGAALGRFSDPSVEPKLIERLGSEWEEKVRTAICSSLGAIGTARALSSLRHTAQIATTYELKQAANRAIAKIESQLTGHESGTLSIVAEDPAGHVAVVNDGEGRVSLAKSEKSEGRVSLTPSSDPDS